MSASRKKGMPPPKKGTGNAKDLRAAAKGDVRARARLLAAALASIGRGDGRDSDVAGIVNAAWSVYSMRSTLREDAPAPRVPRPTRKAALRSLLAIAHSYKSTKKAIEKLRGSEAYRNAVTALLDSRPGAGRDNKTHVTIAAWLRERGHTATDYSVKKTLSELRAEWRDDEAGDGLKTKK